MENAKCRGILYSVNELVRSSGRLLAGFPPRQFGANRAGLVVDRVAMGRVSRFRIALPVLCPPRALR